MRYLLLTLVLVMANFSGCQVPVAQKASKSSPSSQIQMVKQVEQQLKVKQYPFFLVLNGKARFKGEQRGEDWRLYSDPSEEKRISIEKKGSVILLSRGKKKETLRDRQFGLLSPRDHLLLLKESVTWTKRLPDRQTKTGTLKGIETQLDSGVLGKKLGDWMGRAFDDGAATKASRKFRLRYRIWYHPETEKTAELTIRIIPLQGTKVQTLHYRFQ
ncbi:hypothetical protein [Salinithrix halophila]|uniref:Outer membrane lipoprotein-sorting protein n=1 Tax=Salinithrix halophila TaxID=1485204 RepID=A0ABV8JGC0_9BACL